MIVYTSAERPFDTLDRVGVAILSHDRGRHSGFVYRVDDGPVMLLHLAWHHKLIRRTPDEQGGLNDNYMWADLAELDAENRRYMVGYLSAVGGDRIPYGLSSEGVEFDSDTSQLKPHPQGKGFTCSTFMLAVFAATHLKVIDPVGWPEGRPGDAEWQAYIVDQLAQEAGDHSLAVAADTGCVRFRPEEVVGASALPGWPHAFSSAEPAGAQVLSEMAAAGKLTEVALPVQATNAGVEGS
jgi:hypothetical protein